MELNLTGEQKLLAIIAHMAYLFGGVGFILAPLVVSLWKKDDPFVYDHAKQALVAHLAILAATVIVSILCTILIGVLLLPVIAIFWIILVVTSLMAAWQAWNGRYYRYPLIQGLVEKL
jgi:uncharacterized protein